MRREAFSLSIALSLLSPIVGCAKTPSARVAEDLDLLNHERSPEKLVARGRAFATVGDFTRAEQYLAAALEQHGDERQILPILMRVCVESKRYRVAIEYAEPYLRKHPSDFHLRFVVGSIYLLIGDTSSARHELERVVADNPNDPDAHYTLAVLFRDNERAPVLADAQFREYLRLAPTGPHAEEARASLLKVVP